LPLCWNAAGLRIGIQFVAPMGDDARLIRLAAQLEQARFFEHIAAKARDWDGRHPIRPH
jgi:Asp-tRNA(Asn)/Glu-tRNA(Gln) amidotransferase A subunit family amidase